MPIISKYGNLVKDEANKVYDTAKDIYNDKDRLYKERFSIANVTTSDLAKVVNSFFTANSNFKSKSIQKNFKFIVDFDDAFEKELTRQNIKIFPHHILSIDIPTSYGFKANVMKIGPYSYSFPTMEHEGFDISVVFEEDDHCSIAKLIHYLQYKIIKSVSSNANGAYFPQTKNRIKMMVINIYNDAGQIVRSVKFEDLFFVSSTPTSLNYDGNESIKYTVVFHCDFMQQDFIS